MSTHLPEATLFTPVVTVTGGATPHAVLADDSDATYVRRSAFGTPMVAMRARWIDASGAETLFAFRARTRAKKITSGQSLALSIWIEETPVLQSSVAVVPVNTIVDLATPPVIYSGSEGFYPLLYVDDPDVEGISASAYVYKAWVSAYYIPLATCAAAVVDADETGSPIQGTQTPRFDIDASAVVEAWQFYTGLTGSLAGRVQTRLFASAVYGAGGFDPSTSVAFLQDEVTEVTSGWSTYTDGTTPDVAALEVTLPGQIAPTGTFRLYVRAQRGTATSAWGEWSYVEFVMSVTPAATPTISATTATEVEVQITPVALASHTDPVIDYERSSDGGSTWTRLQTGIAGTYGVATVMADTRAPRGVALTYRARVRDRVGTGNFESAWATDAADARAADGWNLKPWSDPVNKGIYGLNVVGRPQRKLKQDVALHYPKGRSHPVVVYGGDLGYASSLEVMCENQDQIDDLEVLLALHEPMLLEDGYKISAWIWISEPEFTMLGTTTAPARRYVLPYVEIDEP